MNQKMENVWDFLKANALYVSVAVGVVGVSWFVFKRVTRKTRKCGVDYPKDTVILHVFDRTKGVPNLGHFVMKLETYLRITKIPYQIDFNHMNGPKNKIPWIEYNGLTMGDSQLIMEFLNKEFSKDINQHLSPLEVSQAWAIQKWIEEFTYWLNVYSRWFRFGKATLINFLGYSNYGAYFAEKLFRSKIRNIVHTVGVGRHSDTEVQAMMENDFRHFSTLLGDKNYLTGDNIAEVDCSAFGILSQVRWATPEQCPGRAFLLGQKNIMEYLDRIKSTYWPDWNDLVLP